LTVFGKLGNPIKTAIYTFYISYIFALLNKFTTATLLFKEESSWIILIYLA